LFSEVECLKGFQKILEEYPHLDKKVILSLLKIGKEAQVNLIKVDIDRIISKRV